MSIDWKRLWYYIVESDNQRGIMFRKDCNKCCYRNKQLAQQVANKITRSRRRRGKPKALRTYFCGVCSSWHLATKKKPTRTLATMLNLALKSAHRLVTDLNEARRRSRLEKEIEND